MTMKCLCHATSTRKTYDILVVIDMPNAQSQYMLQSTTHTQQTNLHDAAVTAADVAGRTVRVCASSKGQMEVRGVSAQGRLCAVKVATVPTTHR